MYAIGLLVLALAGLVTLGQGGKGALTHAVTVMAALGLFGAALALASRGVFITAVPVAALAAGMLYSQSFKAPKAAKASSNPNARKKARGMSATEALSVLGLGESAQVRDVEHAFRLRMRTAHPDAGGSHDMAAQLNLARSVLLRRLSA
jgi:hypothetical protein